MFERYVGRETLLREALEKLVPQVYEEAVKEEALDPIDQPKFEIPTFEPLLIKATVPVRPHVELGDYRSVRVDRVPAEVTAEQVDGAIENLRQRYATVEPVERTVKSGDIVRASIVARAGDRELLRDEDADLRVTDEAMRGLPGLAEKLVGTDKGNDYTFDVEVPEAYEDSSLAGQSVRYDVSIQEVKQEKLPELDDAFASEVGEGFTSLAALREKVTADLEKRAQDEADRAYEKNILDALYESMEIEFPPVLVEREVEHILSEQAGSGSLAGLEAMMRRGGGSLDTLRQIARPMAADRVRRTLVLTAVAESEGLSVEDAEVEQELTLLAGSEPTQAAQFREVFDTENGREMIGRTVLTRKTYERLREIAEGKELPPLPERPATAEAGAEGEAAAAGEAEATEEAVPDGGQPEAEMAPEEPDA
jgi:trigger factor